MSEFKDRRLLTTLLKESILQLCKISVGLVGNYEIDGIICISRSEADDEHIVVKVHEHISKDGISNRASHDHPSLYTQSESRSEREYVVPRKNSHEDLDLRCVSSSSNSHKRWMNSRQNERNHTRCVSGEASRFGRYTSSHVQRVGSVSPERQSEHSVVASNGSAQLARLHHNVYTENRTVFPESVPQDCGIGHCSYPISSESRHLPLQAESVKLGRKRAGSCDVNVSGNKKRMQRADADFSEEVASDGSQMCDDTEDFKHTLAAAGLSEMLDCTDVAIKKEDDTLDDCETVTSTAPPAGQSNTPTHSVVMPTCSVAGYDIVLSSQDVNSVPAVVSTNGIVQPVNSQDVQTFNQSSLDTENGPSDGAAVLPPKEGDDTSYMSTSSKHSCAQCRSSFPSREELTDHFSVCHTCTMTHYCDRCHQGFSDEQAYTTHDCCSELEIHTDTANCNQVSTSPGTASDDTDGCQLSVTDNVTHSSSKREQTVNDPPTFASGAGDSCNTMVPELSYNAAMHTDEPPTTSAANRTDTEGQHEAGDRSFPETLSGSEGDYTRQVEQNIDANNGGDFRCSVCQLQCYSYTSLETHSLREHKRYTCPHCSKSFTQTSSRNRHMYTHGCRQPFACLHCSARFTRADTLRKHYARHHQMTAMPAWLSMNISTRCDAPGTVERGQSLDSVTLESAWPADVNRDILGYQTYLATRNSAEMIEISDEGE
ncbi:hypothetical protein NP493_351g01017 [Ridgeia piscesae]|uniref:C2H2-type domain-containing protein n=1 Tax=Ridgeia piscesae TaxID=27915 RepID=A0AAD9L3M1_RIDPI|nr:hypothetical protein NP493_351g01017 [Ridgeia piscesae]